MEKNIKLTMDANRAVRIAINNEEKYIIPENNRNISADIIYDLIGFSIDDHYNVTKENKAQMDEQVLNFFYELFNEIVIKINSLADNTEETNSDYNTEPDFPDEIVDDIPF